MSAAEALALRPALSPSPISARFKWGQATDFHDLRQFERGRNCGISPSALKAAEILLTEAG